MFDLPLIWALLIATAIFIYVVLDGFDLGIGILFPFLKAEDRNTAINTVAPVWDGNETWLILGGGGLFATFPLAYSVLMPALYMPVLLMLFGLIFRGVAFEFRWRSEAHKRFWDRAFMAGSITAALCQGIALGAFIQGVEVTGRAYAGGWWDWLSPFSLLTGVSLAAGYALLGAAWLVMKTEGSLAGKARRYSRVCLAITLTGIGAVSLATLYLDTRFVDAWLSSPVVVYTAVVPFAVVLCASYMWVQLARGADYKPFLSAVVLFLLCFIGLGISLFPYVVPFAVTIWQGAAPDGSLGFLLVGTLVLLPAVIGYTAYAYYVFRGKVKAGEGYH